MLHICTLAAAVLGAALAGTHARLPQDDDGEPRGRCIWETGVPNVVIDGLMACGDDESVFAAAREALDEHAKRHGWSSWRGQIDLACPEHSARCPERELDLLVRSTLPCSGLDASYLRDSVAQGLAHNGRVDQALAMLDEQLDEERRACFRFGIDELETAEARLTSAAAARIAATDHRWDAALRYAEHWEPLPGCGFSVLAESAEIQRFRLRCWVELGRWKEVREHCVRAVSSEWRIDACVAESWIESFVREGGGAEPEAVIEMLAAFARPDHAESLRKAAQHWRILRRPPAERLARIAELGGVHDDELVIALRHASAARIEELATHLFEGPTCQGDGFIAQALAESGHAAAGPWLERAVDRLPNAECTRLSAGDPFERWKLVRAQLDALSQD